MWKKKAYRIVGILLLFTIVHTYFISKLNFDYNFENFYPIEDDDRTFYENFRTKFSGDNDFLIIGFSNRAGIFQSDFLTHVDQFSDEIRQANYVEDLISITNMINPVLSPAGFYQVPLIHIDEPDRYNRDSTALYNQEVFVGNFISKDGKSLAVILKHPLNISKSATDSLLNKIHVTATKYQLHDIHIAGRVKAQGVYIDKMAHELKLFISISLLFVIIFLAITYQSLWNILVPIVLVILSVVWLMGIMGMFGKSLDPMLSLLPSIMFVVAMSDVVHILTKYIEELRQGKTKFEAIKLVIKEIGLATFLTSLTTAVGFCTLLTTGIKIIREFGIYAALGVIIAYVLAFTLLPAILLIIPKPSIVNRKLNRKYWQKLLSAAFMLIIKNYRLIIYMSVVLLAFCAIGISKIQVNAFLLGDIEENDPLMVDYQFFDQKFGGTRPLEIAIEVLDSTKSIFDDAVINDLKKVEGYLINKHHVSGLVSPLTALRSLNQTINGGLSRNYKLPESAYQKRRLQQNKRYLEKSSIGQQLFGEENKLSRFSGRMKDYGTRMALERNEMFDQFVRTNTDTTLVKFRITGSTLLFDKNNQMVTTNLMKGLIIAFLVVALIAGLMFKSARMIVIVLLPNIIPLLVIAAIMGFFDIHLKLSTSIIFSIAFGIAVDDTIHFISKLRLELNKGTSILYAIKRTYFTTGKAIIITTIILMGGFFTLVLSGFGSTFYIGLLVSITLLVALLIDISLLPVLLILFSNKKLLNNK